MTFDYDGQTGEVIDGQLVRAPQQGSTPVDLLAIIEKRNQLLERVLQYAIQATHAEQWNDLGGKPWPTGPACEAMARRCGVSLTNVSQQKQLSSDDKGEFYIWVVRGTASLPSGYDSIEVFGTCSSRDSFLGTETTAGRAMSEIDEGNIMKAAYTNMEVNAITRLLGVRNLSWDRLGQVGLDRSKMGKVDYESGARGGGKRAEGGDIEIKWGNGKGKKLRELNDEDLAFYVSRWAEEIEKADPAKAKFKANTEKSLAAGKEEQAKRANAKAGTAAPGAQTSVTVWQRLQQLAAAQNLPIEKLKELIKQIVKKEKVNPTELTEKDLTDIADAIALLKKQEESF